MTGLPSPAHRMEPTCAAGKEQPCAACLKGEDVLRDGLPVQRLARLQLQLVHCRLARAACCLQIAVALRPVIVAALLWACCEGAETQAHREMQCHVL